MIKTPKNEILWVQYLGSGFTVTHIITSDKHRDTYKLYKVEGDNLIYTKHKASDPRDLERWVYGDE